MDTARLLLLVLTLVMVFVSLPPISSGQAQLAGAEIKMSVRSKEFVKGVFSGIKWHRRLKKVNEFLGDLGLGVGSSSDDAQSIDDMELLAIDFSVGTVPQKVTALLDINSYITWIYRYQPTFEAPSTSICQYPCKRDTFTFSQGFKLESYFKVLGSGTSPTPTIGVISFSMSDYSVVSNLPPAHHRFSYFIPYKSSTASSFKLGNFVSIPPMGVGIQSTNIVPIIGKTHLYNVVLSKIYVGITDCSIDPLNDLSNNVILDTVSPATILAEPAYNKVKKIILQQINGTPKNHPAMKELEMCYDSSPQWPNLTLSFATFPIRSTAPQMVLKKENYVVQDVEQNLECVAILQTTEQDFSVIGIMAQLDRQMIFDNYNKMVYFDQYPEVAFSSNIKPRIVLPAFYLISVVSLILCS